MFPDVLNSQFISRNSLQTIVNEQPITNNELISFRASDIEKIGRSLAAVLWNYPFNTFK
jgi:hypothetical protein